MTRLSELMDMRGRCALLTGAAGHLGRTMAESLAEMGADLMLVDRAVEPLEQLADELRQRGTGSVRCFAIDLEDAGQRAELAEAAGGNEKGVQVLINNAAFVGTSGLNGWATPFEQQSVDTWRRALEVNLTAVFDLCQRFAPSLKASRGAIVNVASIYGEFGPDWSLYEGTQMANPAAYAASKGGVIQLTRWLSTTLAPDVRVNSISPGGIARGQPPIFVERYEARTPLGRMAREDDFRGAIAYLASDLSAYVTGQNLRVDGGWGSW